MWRFKSYMKSIILRNEKSMIQCFIQYLFQMIGISIVTSFLSFHFFYNIYKDSRILIQYSLFFSFLFIELYYVYNKISTVLNDSGILFLKKLGFSINELLLFVILKFKNYYLIFIGTYSIIFWIDNALNPWSLITCILGALGVFCIIVLLSSIYYIFTNKFIIIAKNIIILIFIHNIFTRIFEGFKINTAKVVISHILINIGKIKQVGITIQLFCLPTLYQGLFLSFLLLLFILFCKHKFFYVDKQMAFTFQRSRKRTQKQIVIKRKVLSSFIIRDVFYILKNKFFLGLQFIFLLVGIKLLQDSDHITISILLIFFIISIFFNNLFLQELFQIDSLFIGLYKKLPLRFIDFMIAKCVSTLIYTMITPCILLIISLASNRIAFYKFLFLSVIVIIIDLLLGLYFSSVILFFFPNVKQTDVPLIISVFVLLVPLVFFIIIFIGIKKGKTKWMEWE